MSNNAHSLHTAAPAHVVLDDLRVSNSLFAEIMDSRSEDVPMTHLSAIAELGMENATRLIEHLGESDKIWLAALTKKADKPWAAARRCER